MKTMVDTKQKARAITITLERSLIGCSGKQKRVVNALGLYKSHQIVKHYETDIIRGMIAKIPHLIKVEAA
jgi:large subunit ribosomal protein L30